MFKAISLAVFALNLPCVFANDELLGVWTDKSYPDKYTYVFNKNNDFTYINKYIVQYKTKIDTSKGVWEVGAWTITAPKKTEQSCNLTIYANSNECCFAYKFIGDNLILTNKYKIQSYGSMCANRVLVRADLKENSQ